ncbi:MAG: hypothetical protein Q4F10_06170 [Corynebacterium glutamicum]|nr:hypothetical protein [Corynebacterium glutamicum]
MKLTQISGVQRGFAQRTLTEADLLNGWKMGTVKQITMSRTDNLVTMEFPGFGLNGAEKTSSVFLTVPAGFRPATPGNYGTLGILTSGNTPVQISKEFNTLATSASTTLSGILMWRTTDPFPPPRFFSKLVAQVARLVRWSK